MINQFMSLNHVTYQLSNSLSIVDVTLLISVPLGLSVIISKNPIVSILNLIGLFLVIAVSLMGLGMSFIGLSYILVYVGAVSILFLFILMLINIRVSELITDNNNGVPLSLIVISVFYIIFAQFSLTENSNVYNYYSEVNSSSYNLVIAFVNNAFKFFLGLLKEEEFDNNTIYKVTSISWDTVLSFMSHITSIGNVIYTSYSILLLVISVILLLAMVGSIVITLRQ